jgi:hypothetical protein
MLDVTYNRHIVCNKKQMHKNLYVRNWKSCKSTTGIVVPINVNFLVFRVRLFPTFHYFHLFMLDVFYG